MKCTNCGMELSDDMKFCINCGTPVQPVKMVWQDEPAPEVDLVCQSCGAQLIRGYKFCTSCGARVSEGESAEVMPKETKAGDFVSYRETSEIIEESMHIPVLESASVPAPAPEAFEVIATPEESAQKGCEFSEGDISVGTLQEPVESMDAAPANFTGENDTAPEAAIRSSSMENNDVAETVLEEEDDVTLTSEVSVVILTDVDRPGVQYKAPIEKELLIGRRRADIVIPDDMEISRSHCRVLLKEDGLYLVDTMSKNGTFYRDCRIVPNQEFQIDSGDVIRIGRHNFRVELVQERV